jgi:predicted DNA-binding mobile mystery protein A
MKNTFKDLRLLQLDKGLGSFLAARSVPRPKRGWLRAMREAIGVSAAEIARKLGTSRQLPLQLEKWEAEDRITLKSLRRMADALDCDLVYAIVPRAGSIQNLVEDRARSEASSRILKVEHSMALEDQAAGGLDLAVEAETRRLTGKRAAR